MTLLSIIGELAFKSRKGVKVTTIDIYVPDPFHRAIVHELNTILDRRVSTESIKPQTVYTTEGDTCIVHYSEVVPERQNFCLLS